MDYSAYQPQTPLDSVLKQISELASRWRDLTDRRNDFEQKIDDLDAEIKQIVERDIPGLLDMNGLESVTTLDGLKVGVKEDIRASIPKALRELAHAWLEEHGHGDVIKTKVVTEFGRGEMENARALAAEIEETTNKTVLIDESVHAQTLGALVRELLREGSEVPQDLLGVARIRKANIQ